MSSITRRELGWQPFFEQQLTLEESDCLSVGRVGSHRGGQVLVLTESRELLIPSSLMEIRGDDDDQDASTIAVGDWFLLDPDRDHRPVRRLDRKTSLYRKAAGETVRPQLMAANIDTVFVVSSCNQDFNLSRLERYLALILEADAMPVVVLTKADLCDDPAQLRQQTESLHAGLIVETVDARDRQQAEVLEMWCGVGKTIAMLGSSGVGKSTLANTLCGLDIQTSGIREEDAKGRHTTTARSMHRLGAGGWLIDNPGMRELQLPACEQGIANLFEDVLQLAQHCRFRNCQHRGDAGCALEAAVQAGDLDQRRLASYLKLQSEQARNSASLAERRERERKTGRMYKRIIADKQKQRRGGSQESS